MEIRFAKKDDLKKLLDIEGACFDQNSFPLSKDNFKYHLSSDDKIVVACINDKIVGYVLIFYYKKSIRIYSIATLYEYRGQKVGFNLIEKIKEIAKNKNISSISLEVKVSNNIAIDFYKKVGFLEKKILKDYYPTEDGLKMIFSF